MVKIWHLFRTAHYERLTDRLAQKMSKKCRACKSNMSEGAYLCTECNSYQDWRKFLHVSSSLVPVLSLVLALLAFLYANANGIKAIFYPPLPLSAKILFDIDEESLDGDAVATVMNIGEISALVQGRVKCFSPSLSYRRVEFVLKGRKVVSSKEVIHVNFEITIFDETDFARTYEEHEQMLEETRGEMEKIWEMGSDFLGKPRNDVSKMSADELRQHEEQMESVLIAYDEEPGYVESVLRNGLFLEDMTCEIQEFAFNENANFNLWSFARRAENLLLDEVFKTKLPS